MEEMLNRTCVYGVCMLLQRSVCVCVCVSCACTRACVCARECYQLSAGEMSFCR